MSARRRQGYGAARGLFAAALATVAMTGAPALTRFATATSADTAVPIAGAFVYPVGDELDFTKPHDGEGYGYYISDPYLAQRGRKKQRTHYGADLANGRGGSPVRAIASGIVVVSDANAMIKVRVNQKVRVPVIVDGKRVYKTSTRPRTTFKWRTGWGNYVVVRHILPSGETVHSLYGHLMPKSILVKRGDIVAASQPIGRVGRTGRATSSHLHIEIRKVIPADPDELVDEEAIEDEPTPEERRFSSLQTVDPLVFLDQHVRRFDDLEPGTWEALYAQSALRDGIVIADRDRFGPGESVNRFDYYRALVATFRLAPPFTTGEWTAMIDALKRAEIIDAAGARRQQADDRITRSEALEILLRCLDRHKAHARNLSTIDADRMCRDFNRQFAGDDAADEAERQAKVLAASETKVKRDAEAARVARARKAAKAAGKKSTVRLAVIKPVKPVPRLDLGFESLAQSKKTLTRAESCLLLATALRLGAERYSALERAASRVSDSG